MCVPTGYQLQLLALGWDMAKGRGKTARSGVHPGPQGWGSAFCSSCCQEVPVANE